jgi:Immunoglobulin domain
LNSAVLIKCRVLANPSAEVSWFKGRDKTRLISSNYERSNDGLKIHRVSQADNDVFWCQADVLETGESKDYPIQVVISRTSTRLFQVDLVDHPLQSRSHRQESSAPHLVPSKSKRRL